MLNDIERRQVAEATRDPKSLEPIDRGRMRALRDRAGPADQRAIDRVLAAQRGSGTPAREKAASVEAGRERARREHAERPADPLAALTAVGAPGGGLPTIADHLGPKDEPEAERFWSAYDAATKEKS